MWRIVPFIEAGPDIGLTITSPRYIGGRLLHLKQTRSTNDLALQDSELLKKNGLVIVTDIQTGGRGRKGRKWHSSTEGNLYATFILHDHFRTPVLPYITIIMGLAVHNTLIGHAMPYHCMALRDCSIKWPNDCLVGRRKIAGILVETRGEVMVIGIGVNIRGKVEDYPVNLQSRVTTVEAECRGLERPCPYKLCRGGKFFFPTVTPPLTFPSQPPGARCAYLHRFDFLRALIENINGLLDQFNNTGASSIIYLWTDSSSSIGRRVLVTEGKHSVEGVIQGITEKGFLLLRQDDHSTIEIISGDVEFI